MRRFFLLLVALMWTLSVLPGCGGAPAPSPVEQEQKLQESQANMKKGMEAMKAMPKPKTN
ncbi:MAG: hypothetical protein ACYC3X_11855 [Pirellulaceae bacterium]